MPRDPQQLRQSNANTHHICQSNVDPMSIHRQSPYQPVHELGTRLLWGPTTGLDGGRFRANRTWLEPLHPRVEADLVPIRANPSTILHQSIANPMSIQCQSGPNPIQSIQGCPPRTTRGPTDWQSNPSIHYQYPDSMSICQSSTNPSIPEQSWTNLTPILCQSADRMPI